MGHKARQKSRETPAQYFARAPAWQQKLAARLQKLVFAAVPDARLIMKWGAPVFVLGDPFAYLGCFSKTVNLGFLRGAQIADPSNLLQGTGKEGRHIQFRSVDEIDEAAVRALLRAAALLSRNKLGKN